MSWWKFGLKFHVDTLKNNNSQERVYMNSHENAKYCVISCVQRSTTSVATVASLVLFKNLFSVVYFPATPKLEDSLEATLLRTYWQVKTGCGLANRVHMVKHTFLTGRCACLLSRFAVPPCLASQTSSALWVLCLNDIARSRIVLHSHTFVFVFYRGY